MGKPEGVSNVFLTYFDYFFGGQYKLGLRCIRGGLNPQPPTNRALLQPQLVLMSCHMLIMHACIIALLPSGNRGYSIIMISIDQQCCKAANKANRKLGMVRRGFKNKTKAVMLPLYKAMVRTVRPYLDYCIQVWRPHLQKDIGRLEKVQRRTSKMIEGLEGCSYLGLTTLETRFVRADLIEVYKIFNGLDSLDPGRFFV